MTLAGEAGPANLLHQPAAQDNLSIKSMPHYIMPIPCRNQSTGHKRPVSGRLHLPDSQLSGGHYRDLQTATAGSSLAVFLSVCGVKGRH
jgi:hypothetical protein